LNLVWSQKNLVDAVKFEPNFFSRFVHCSFEYDGGAQKPFDGRMELQTSVQRFWDFVRHRTKIRHCIDLIQAGGDSARYESAVDRRAICRKQFLFVLQLSFASVAVIIPILEELIPQMSSAVLAFSFAYTDKRFCLIRVLVYICILLV